VSALTVALGLGRTDVPLRRVCCYCSAVMAEGHPEAAVSYGICPACEPRIKAPRLFDLIDDVGAALERTSRGRLAGGVDFLAQRRSRLEALLRCLEGMAARPTPTEVGECAAEHIRRRFL
jgi:hypothetical protein